MNLVKKKIKIGEFFDKYTEKQELNEIQKLKTDVFIKAKSGKLVKLAGAIKKDKCDIYELKFSNGNIFKCADKHVIETPIGFRFVEDLKIGDKVLNLLDGEINLVSSKKILYDYVYDISMEEEFVYTTPNGLIHHNTMLAIQTMGNAQLQLKNDLLVSFLDSEEATTIIRMANLGVRYPKIKPYNDITVEKVFKFIEGLCLYKETKGIMDKPSIIVWDSIANTLSQKEREVEDINSALGYKARILSLLIPKYVSKLSIYNICLITVNQLRDSIQIGPFSSPKELNFMRQGKTIPGGNTLRYNTFHMLEMKVKSVVDIEKFGFDGIVCEIKCVKNKLFPPNIPINIVGNFVTGFDNFWTNYLYLIENKRLTSAAWCYLNSLPNMKFRTKEAKDLYLKDQVFKTAFDEAIRETIQIELIDRNTCLI